MHKLLSLVFICSICQAQTWDVDITINQYTFAGSFVDNAGTLSAVNISDGFDQGTLTAGVIASNGTAVFTDYEGANPLTAGSEVYQLLFTPNFANSTLSNVAFQENAQWGFNCGIKNEDSGQTPTCTASMSDPPTHAAPELGSSGAAAALTLLTGMVLIRQRKRQG